MIMFDIATDNILDAVRKETKVIMTLQTMKPDKTPLLHETQFLIFQSNALNADTASPIHMHLNLQSIQQMTKTSFFSGVFCS